MARTDSRWPQVWRKRGHIGYRSLFLLALTGLVLLSGSVPPAAGNWPQFMRDSAHTGDAPDEALRLPLEFVAQVRLDDAAMTSPAVVGGLAYVRTGKLLWESPGFAPRAPV